MCKGKKNTPFSKTDQEKSNELGFYLAAPFPTPQPRGLPVTQQTREPPHRMMSVYSRSLPLLSFHFLYITEASTLAGEKVLGSLRREMTLRRMVLGEHRGSGWGPQGSSLAAPSRDRHCPRNQAKHGPPNHP